MQTTAVTSLPLTGFIRQKQILGEPKSGVFGPIPISATQWWEGIRDGRYPAPVRLGPNTVAWRAEEIHALIARLTEQRSASRHEPNPKVAKLLTQRGNQKRTEQSAT